MIAANDRRALAHRAAARRNRALLRQPRGMRRKKLAGSTAAVGFPKLYVEGSIPFARSKSAFRRAVVA
jgi:hypothetical protein